MRHKNQNFTDYFRVLFKPFKVYDLRLRNVICFLDINVIQYMDQKLLRRKCKPPSF